MSANLAASEQSPTPSRARFRYIRPRRGPWLQVVWLAGFEWNCVELEIAGLPDALVGLRIWHLTDTHLRRRWREALDEVIGRAKVHPPDLMLFTGDFVDDKRDHRPALPLVERMVRGLRGKFGTFAVIGNHDGDLLGPRLTNWGVRLLMHRRVEVNVNGAAVELMGLPGVDRLDLNERFIADAPAKKAGVPRI